MLRHRFFFLIPAYISGSFYSNTRHFLLRLHVLLEMGITLEQAVQGACGISILADFKKKQLDKATAGLI